MAVNHMQCFEFCMSSSESNIHYGEALPQANESFADACLVLEQTLSWVHASKMHVIKMILARVHQKIHLEIQAHTQKQVERLMLLESNMDHGIRIRELLKPFQHQVHALCIQCERGTG